MISVTPDRQVQCRISVAGFLDNLRLANGVRGRGTTARCGFFFVGIKEFPSHGFASVYFSLPGCGQEELLSRLRTLSENLKSTQVVVFSSWPDCLPPDLLKAGHLYVTDISDCFEINWPGEVSFASAGLGLQSYSLRREGKLWHLVFQGERATIPHRKGIQYLAHLLRHPGESFTPSELAYPDAEAADALEAFEAADAKAIRQYRARLDELNEDLEIAVSAGDDEQARNLEEEREAIMNHLKATVGLGGKPRLKGELERHRQSVSKALERALRALPIGRDHIATRLKRGYRFSYHPDPSEKWEV